MYNIAGVRDVKVSQGIQHIWTNPDFVPSSSLPHSIEHIVGTSAKLLDAATYA